MDLYIDNVRADITRNSFAVNWKWYDIMNPIKRYTVSSTNINLPFSVINNKIIEYTNISGSDLTPIWDELESKIYFGNYVALTGSLKVKDIDVSKKQINTSIRGDNNIISLINSNTAREVMRQDAIAEIPGTWTSLSLAIDGFNAGTYGWLLPVIDDGTNLLPDAATRLLYVLTATDDLRSHELWISLDNFITKAFSMASVELEVFESGSITTYSGSNIQTAWENEYMPAYHMCIMPGVGAQVRLDVDEDRYFESGTESIDSDDLIICGGLDTWDVFKIACQKFNLGIYIDQTETKVTIFDLNTTATPTKDWTDKLIKYKKSPVIKGYAKTNYIKFKPTDNLDSTFGQIQLDNNSLITYLNETKTLGTIDIGIPGIYDYYGTTSLLVESNVFKLNYFSEKTAYNSVVMLNKANLSVSSISVGMFSALGDRAALKQMYRMAFSDTTTYFDWLESRVLDINEVYDTEIYLNLNDLVDLKPYELVKVNQLGSEMYVNQIKGFNFNKPSKVELVKLT